MSRSKKVFGVSLVVVALLLATAGAVMSNDPNDPSMNNNPTTPETTPPPQQPEQPQTSPEGQTSPPQSGEEGGDSTPQSGEKPAPTEPPVQTGSAGTTGSNAPADEPSNPESELLDALIGRQSALGEIKLFTDCNLRHPNPTSACVQALNKSDEVAKKFAKLVKNIGTPEQKIVQQAAFLALLKDNSNPPKLAFPSVHAAFPVIVRLARWGTSSKDPEKAASSRIAAQRLSILLTRLDLDGRSDQVAAELKRRQAEAAEGTAETGQ